MLNILIIPVKKPDCSQEIINFAREIKDKFPDCSISVIVNIKNYDFYYTSNSIDGLIVEPDNSLKRFKLIMKDYYDLVLYPESNLLWRCAVVNSKPKKKLGVSAAILLDKHVDIVNMLSELSLQENKNKEA